MPYTNGPDIRLTRRGRSLLACGIIAGPMFLGVAVVQGLLRPGFSLVHQPISFLSLGAEGWIQRVNFIAAGTLVVALAEGVRRMTPSLKYRLGKARLWRWTEPGWG